MSFAYRNEDWVLKDFSLEIKAGEKIGIVGPTGSGKTTLISLLLRFYEPQKGRILVDGIDLKDWDLRILRTAIGIIQQDVFLFSGSSKENISLWRKGEALELGRPEFERISQPNLLEGGINLSRGERQIISFCRTLFGRPKLWILDEATANIDSESERGLVSLLDRHAENHTTLVIAHRLSTVRSMNRILVLNHGVLIEQGSHEELLRHDGLYARLYKYQNLSVHADAHAEARNDRSLECKS